MPQHEITIYVPDELRAFIDLLLTSGFAESEQQIITRSLECYRERLIWLETEQIIRTGQSDDEEAVEMPLLLPFDRKTRKSLFAVADLLGQSLDRTVLLLVRALVSGISGKGDNQDVLDRMTAMIERTKRESTAN